DEAGIRALLPDHSQHRARHAGRAVHVHSKFNQSGHDLGNLLLAGPFLHYNNHGVGLLRSCVSHFSVNSPCTTRRSSRLASSIIRSNSLAIASGSSGPSAATLFTWSSTCFSRSG